ncbi:hypothetical protein Y032_0324g2539 [Ancylostoma ceylanicum]|uniref:Uncharacterized protein n=1 Tax=Ancylostoma ceylanicum TaxID=53326 RepID=A0A016S0C7_9BILA|nr:hypothetical protein Y032_0324g2539 [Ancylostoma ceylanicum]
MKTAIRSVLYKVGQNYGNKESSRQQYDKTAGAQMYCFSSPGTDVSSALGHDVTFGDDLPIEVNFKPEHSSLGE